MLTKIFFNFSPPILKYMKQEHSSTASAIHSNVTLIYEFYTFKQLPTDFQIQPQQHVTNALSQFLALVYPLYANRKSHNLRHLDNKTPKN